ncbi:hypothetical protein NCU08249 [Neurospora crassa OR74A]|uniref:Uncharacterized protein n=1 Tax=Neurospora crassa (strain ATCC 24698 / 74-OR23-1A / CBS 708.71 / DSM 1257 / FGSC 987) TaxID=367110 RepID=Q7S3J4_NEUCR|nr:hypothetical protein NCU08249 [Neurospora crassa OR74A]EAA30103.3 hypothetical protein NCU08249 [Neurospora crassa OR74A]|eukprot:XP_959339.3 hypothetical protein NCU08249 [Neurospora crassa OR74A]
MSNNTFNNINMGNYHNGTVPNTSIIENNQDQMANDTPQSSIPPATVFNFNTPIDRGMHTQDIHHQGQYVNMAPPPYLADPFNPIHYQHLAHIKTLEDVFDDYPVDFQSPLNFEYAAIDAAAAVLDASYGRCTRTTRGVQCTRFC